MLNKPTLTDRFRRREWLRRLDRAVGDLNIVLFMVAIGLATLDLTFVVTQRVIDRLPQATRAGYAGQSAVSARVTAGPSDLR